MYTVPRSRYQEGDQVRVVSVKQLQRCPFGINDQMEALSGQVVTIKSAKWSSYSNRTEYRIEEDCCKWLWSDNCFESAERVLDLPDFVASDISGLL